MKFSIHSSLSLSARALLSGLVLTVLTGYVAVATPYATSITNDGFGIVSFRLNQTTGTNDLVQIISNGGVLTNTLQSPGGNPITRGLNFYTNASIAAGTVKIHISHLGTGAITTNGPAIDLAFGTPRGITCNIRTNSPYFGWVYLSNANTNSNAHGDGIFAFGSDLSDILGQGNSPRNGGYTGFSSSTSFSPYKLYMGPDDSLLVTDDSDATANLIALNPLLTSFGYVLKPIQANPVTGQTGAVPVGTNNNHGSMAAGWIVGSGAGTTLYTMDEDYQQDPTASTAYEMNSVWKYTIGTNYNGVNSTPWSNAPDRIIAQPYLSGFAGQNEGIQYHEFPGAKHYLYYNQRRSNPPQYTMYIADLDNLPDPSTYGNTGGTMPWGDFWDSQTESLNEGYSDDVLRDMIQISVSPDGRWMAGIIASGSGADISAPDGSVFQTLANDVYVIPITNGVPNLPARQILHIGGAANGREVAFDAVNNLYWASSGLGIMNSLDIGESTDVTTGSDGSFLSTTPATQVSIVATQPIASETGPTPAVFTVSRTTEDLANPKTVSYNIGGTAQNGVDYVTITNKVTIAAGQTSTNITATPIDDNVVEPVETIILTVVNGAGYGVGFPGAATAIIQDNETPQLQILSLSTNIYQGVTNDYALVRILRLGNTNVDVFIAATNIVLGGTAVSNVDYYLPNLPFTIPGGVVSYTNFLIYPGLSGSSAIGTRSITVTFQTNASGNYTVTNATASITLQLKALPAGTTLYSDDFENDPAGTNWNVFWATYTNAPTDYALQFGYDYTAGDLSKLLPPLPLAPHSAAGAGKGVYMTVNKSDSFAVSAALNLYLKNHVFSNNYAFRMDMMLIRNSGGNFQSQVEDALFGINHSGTRTNWFRNAQTGTSLPGSPTASDGLFFDIGADGSGGAGAIYDFAVWSGPTWTNNVTVVGPTNTFYTNATAMAQLFKRPPYDAAHSATGVPTGGTPANTVLSTTPTWGEVEISQIITPNGPLITWKVNNSVVYSFYNTNTAVPAGSAFSYTNGTVMLGYDDPWDDIANGGAGAGEGCVIFDNVRVVSVSTASVVAGPSNIVACAGTATNLSVTGSSTTGTLKYQWSHAGTNLPGATTSSLSLPSLAFADWGTYQVLLDDGAYQTLSSEVTVLPPTLSDGIVTQPVSRAAVQGSTISPAFTAKGTTCSQQTNYQWYSNSVAIAGATAASLNLANVQAGSFTPNTFYVTVNDGANSLSVTSSTVTLTHPVSPTVTNSVAGPTLSMKFPSEFGPAYVTEYKTNLTAAAWKPLITNAGSGSAITVTDSLSAAPTRFYRVRLQ